ncbi:hypothetical protein LCGC14_0563000 [marine sediment metagenome]|uniref:Mandelate racemase/muconate lactonizing enzyme C-terminal domain-containing protein n=1 Tax=marine sediment metagenome TaxID=412755 RepID=A0A0F9S563_9ZZZZ|nr:hypothetical protein [Phycisphaerae bacterium]HDZ44648.1 hypothetical protein [Phycisphaerae bacterium]
MAVRPIRMDIYRTAIPTRGFMHAAAERNVAEAVVVCVEFDDGQLGWGETLPREYVTGETIESVVDDLACVIWPRWAGVAMGNGETVTEIAPAVHELRCINAAICAFDIACMRRLFDRIQEISPEVLAELGGRAQVRRELDVPVSGVLGAGRRRNVRRRLRAMQWWGMDQIKLKLTADERQGAEALQVVSGRLGKALRSGRATLRVDVNGAWDAASAPERITALKAWNVCAVEQPVYGSAQDLVDLARKCPLPLIADESLLTEADANVLLTEPRIWWNIRLSKNGGLVGALKLARLAASRGVTFIIGCMVGESGILSAAQRRMLQLGPGPRFVEGNYGRWLLRGDLTQPSLRFGYGGLLRTRPGEGLGVQVDRRKLATFGQRVKTCRA